jgi:hypothetical protein
MSRFGRADTVKFHRGVSPADVLDGDLERLPAIEAVASRTFTPPEGQPDQPENKKYDGNDPQEMESKPQSSEK